MIMAKGTTGGRARQPRHFVPLKNQPGELISIDKKELRVDPTYQRDVNMRQVYRMANNWSWIACGALIVSLRSNGLGYFIIDGQHRWEAAKQRDDIRDLPCLAFVIDALKDEAIGFLSANTERKVPTINQQFSALLLSNDPITKVVDQLAHEAGRKVAGKASPTTIKCVSQIMRCVRQNETTTRRIWPLMTALSMGKSFEAKLLHGLWALEGRMPSGYSLSDKSQADRLKRIGSEEIIRNIRAVVAIDGVMSDRSVAQGVLRALNKGRRNPIVVDMSR